MGWSITTDTSTFRLADTTNSITRIPADDPSAAEEVFASLPNGAFGLAFLGDWVYASTYSGENIYRIHKETKAKEVYLDTPGSWPIGIWFDEAGNLYMADWIRPRIRQFDGGQVKTVLDLVGLDEDAVLVRVGPDGNFYLAMVWAGVRKYAPDWKSYEVVSATETQKVYGAAFLPDGRLVYTVWDTNQVYLQQTSGLLSGTPAKSAVGEHEVVLRATNDSGSTDQEFTITVLDQVGPVAQSFSPADRATEVALDADLVIGFDEPVALGQAGTLSLYDGDEKEPFTSLDLSEAVDRDRLTLSADQLTLTIDPASHLRANAQSGNSQLSSRITKFLTAILPIRPCKNPAEPWDRDSHGGIGRDFLRCNDRRLRRGAAHKP